MSSTSPNMSLIQWDLVSDFFNHSQLADNWNKVDIHDHSGGRGVQISSAGIANSAVGSDQLQDEAVTTGKYALASVGTDQLIDLSVSTGKLGLLSVGTAQLMDASVTASKLAPGAVTISSLGVKPYCLLWNSNNQAVPNAAATTVFWDTTIVDTGSMHSTTSNTSRIVIAQPGTYIFTTSFEWDLASTSGQREARIIKNGDTAAFVAQSGHPAESTSGYITRSNAVSPPIPCQAGDYFQTNVWQNSGGNLNINSYSRGTGIHRVGSPLFGAWFISL